MSIAEKRKEEEEEEAKVFSSQSFLTILFRSGGGEEGDFIRLNGSRWGSGIIFCNIHFLHILLCTVYYTQTLASIP